MKAIRLSLSHQDAKEAFEALNELVLKGALWKLADQLRRELKPKKPQPISIAGGHARARKVAEKLSARDRRAAIRVEVFARANGQCEGPRGSDPANRARCENVPSDLAHAFGRGKGRRPESAANCLAFCRDCHRAETRNHPDGVLWWSYFAFRFRVNGDFAEAAAAEQMQRYAEGKAAMPAAPRIHASSAGEERGR